MLFKHLPLLIPNKTCAACGRCKTARRRRAWPKHNPLPAAILNWTHPGLFQHLLARPHFGKVRCYSELSERIWSCRNLFLVLPELHFDFLHLRNISQKLFYCKRVIWDTAFQAHLIFILSFTLLLGDVVIATSAWFQWGKQYGGHLWTMIWLTMKYRAYPS